MHRSEFDRDDQHHKHQIKDKYIYMGATSKSEENTTKLGKIMYQSLNRPNLHRNPLEGMLCIVFFKKVF